MYRKEMKEKDKNIEHQFGNPKIEPPFRVPEGYFETFADRLKARIEEEEHHVIKRSVFFYLKPVLSMAASIALIILLVNAPIRKFLSPEKVDLAVQQSNNDSSGSNNSISEDLLSYLSEDQFLSAVTDMDNLEPQTLSADNLADYIAADYNDYEIITEN